MKKVELYSGKVKTLYLTDDPQQLIVYYSDKATAFNAKKTAQFHGKGVLNNYINGFLMKKLELNNISTHFIKILSPLESLVQRLDMLPLECVVRNIAAGSLCRRLGIEEGTALSQPIFEFFLKDDDLGDPFINEEHIKAFSWAAQEEVEYMKTQSLQINTILQKIFSQAGLILVDFKLEFGRFNNKLVLGDEITPDGCRIWTNEAKRKLDKDCFRNDLGNLVASYKEVAELLEVPLPEALVT
jgi:phosphoribosylaminoimidazole-succinocarboxamide synthase